MLSPPVYSVNCPLRQRNPVKKIGFGFDCILMAKSPEDETVLVVDNEPGSVEAIRTALKSQTKLNIISFDSSVSLHRFLDQQPWTWFPKFALVDLVLPAVSGYDVIRRLRNRFDGRRIPIIVVSKMSTGEDILEAQVAGADAFVRKPFASETLMEAIHGCLENAKKTATDRRYSIAYYL